MCGIAGVVNFNGLNEEHETLLFGACNAMQHRGPDNEGFYISDKFAFGQRRLSIIDLSSTANQPMACEDDEVILSFNGEIYNHADIRKELEGKYNFKTDHSDTEALLYAFKEWGIDCVKKLTGMFAISVYDKRTDTLYLVRDRIGQKPLYYYHDNDDFYFSSEINAFFEAEICTKEIRSESIYHYLTFLTVDAPYTFFKDIYKLEAGKYIKISPSGIEHGTYWDISEHLRNVSKDPVEEATTRTEQLLSKSMEYRNISDAPVALALSGGLDSSLNLYYSKQYNDKITAINLDFEGEASFNESPVAQAYCDELGVKLHRHVVDESEFIELIPEYLSIQKDQPLGDPNFVLMYLLSRICREQNNKVLLVGEGGDEIGGYPKYLAFDQERKRLERIPGFGKRWLSRSGNFKFNKFDLFHKGKVISHAHVHGFTEAQKKRMWKGEHYNSYAIIQRIMDEIPAETEDSYLRSVVNLEYKLRLPELILARIDYPSMAASVEARSPFADHKLIEYAASLPFSVKMKGGEPKHLLKKIAKDKLPDYVLNHPKVGFGKMLNDFLNERLPGWFETEVLGTDSPLFEYLEKKEVERFFNYAMKQKRMKYQIWMLYALHKWLEEVR